MPASSEQILAFLDELDGLRIDLVTAGDYVRWFQEDSGDIGAMSEKELEDCRKVRKFIQRVVKAKQEPSRDLSALAVQTIAEYAGESLLDEAITRLLLLRIPEMVRRWKKLQALEFVALPADRVIGSLRQAIHCYLYGLPDAAMVLCRAVLQSALEEAFLSTGDLSLGDVGKRNPEGYLKSLIISAERAHILDESVAIRAHQVRKAGGRAAHEGGSAEGTALGIIQGTRQILQHIYHPPSRNSSR